MTEYHNNTIFTIEIKTKKNSILVIYNSIILFQYVFENLLDNFYIQQCEQKNEEINIMFGNIMTRKSNMIVLLQMSDMTEKYIKVDNNEEVINIKITKEEILIFSKKQWIYEYQYEPQKWKVIKKTKNNITIKSIL